MEGPHIILVPICSECGDRIYEPVSVYEIPEQLSCQKSMVYKPIYLQHVISPSICPHCKAVFENVKVPIIHS